MNLNYILRRPARFASVAALGTVVCIGLGAGSAFGEDAYFDGNKLVIPEVVTGIGWVYRQELIIGTYPDISGVYPFSSKPIMQMFRMGGLQSVFNPTLQNPAGFVNGNLVVPRIKVGDAYFWVMLQAWDMDPPSYEVIDYGEDDEDDDNDGIPDAEDSDPWRASSDSDPLGIVGSWTLRRELYVDSYYTDLSDTPCSWFPTLTYQEIEVTFDVNDGKYSFGSDGQSVKVEYPLYEEPGYYGFSASYPSAGGYIDTSFRLLIDSPQLITGVEYWDWHGDSGSCEDKVSIVHAIKK